MASEQEKRIRKIYVGDDDFWPGIEDEAERRGLMRGDVPNVSKCVQILCDEARAAAAPGVASLAARAMSDAKDTKAKIRAALVVTDGVVSKAAPVLGTSDRDLRRAIDALDMKGEIAEKYKGAAS
jgi:transcriptional regulator with GAF, ATPase, and Fis domain